MTTKKNATHFTPEMLTAMSAGTKKAVKTMTIELVNRTQYLTKKDIKTWRTAHQQALNVDSPRRGMLYDIYDDCLLDLHLTGCISQRKGYITKKSSKIVNRDGKEDPSITELFQDEWFLHYKEHIIDSIFYGHTLVQMGDVVTPVGGNMRFTDVTLIPRRHVVPEKGVITREPGADWRQGIPYRSGEYAAWCIEAGSPTDLGLLLKCAPPCISKKNMLAFWDTWGEMFGMPIRIGKTTSRDKEDYDKITSMLQNMAAASWGLFPDGTDIEIKETTRSDAWQVYDQRISRANSEISKGVLAQTMTIDSGASLSQSQVHLEIFQNLIKSDADMLAYNINNRLLPFMRAKGFPIGDNHFEWDNHVEYSPEEQLNIEQMLLSGGYEIAPKYFADRYHIPIAGRTSPTAQNNLNAPDPFFS